MHGRRWQMPERLFWEGREAEGEHGGRRLAAAWCCRLALYYIPTFKNTAGPRLINGGSSAL